MHLFVANAIMSYQNFYSGSSSEDNSSNKNFVKFVKNFFSINNIINFNFGNINFDSDIEKYKENNNKIELEIINNKNKYK